MQKIPYEVFLTFEHEFQICDEYKYLRFGQAFSSWSGLEVTPELFYEESYKVARAKIIECHVFYPEKKD